MAEQGHELPDILALAHDVEASDTRRAAVGPDRGRQRPQEGRFSRAVRSGHHQHRTTCSVNDTSASAHRLP
jgi:hypothetical protein